MAIYSSLRQKAVTPGQPERKAIRAQQLTLTQPGAPGAPMAPPPKPATPMMAPPGPGVANPYAPPPRPTTPAMGATPGGIALQPPGSALAPQTLQKRGFMQSVRDAVEKAKTPVALPPSLQTPPTTTEPAATPFRNLGQDFLADYDKANERNIRERYRQGGQQAAKFGILGSGMAQNIGEDIARDVEMDRLGFAYDAHRDERDFRLQQRMSEEDLRNAAFQRMLQQAEFTATGGSKRAAFERASTAAANAEAGIGGATDLLSRWAYEDAIRRGGAAGARR